MVTRDLRDPRLVGAIVVRVEMSDDLRNARIYVRRLEGADETAVAAMLEGLKRASVMLRREVSKRVGLRVAPELRFYFDEGQDATTRIEELLEEVKRGK